jgi:hypothetical protein
MTGAELEAQRLMDRELAYILYGINFIRPHYTVQPAGAPIIDGTCEVIEDKLLTAPTNGAAAPQQ